MKIILAAAFGKNNELGKNGAAPLWNLPDEYNRFLASIKNHPIVIGRKSFDAMDGPIDGSLNIVLTSQPNYKRKGIIVTHSLEEALQKAGDSTDVYVIGGGHIFQEVLNRADRMELSRIDGVFPDADAFFPHFLEADWNLILEERHDKDANHQYSFTFQVWERKS
ncbi:MAG TPA: dihydrofolate reductase [Edaphocola sp.]|nr:dihydrofolate reductase [Edaphocola sp.]